MAQNRRFKKKGNNMSKWGTMTIFTIKYIFCMNEKRDKN